MGIGKWLLGAGAAGAAVEYGIAKYFFNRAMIRGNTSTEKTTQMAGTSWDTYLPEMKRKREWLCQNHSMEPVSICSHDGLKLWGTFIPVPNSKKIVLCFHGYSSQGMNDFPSLAMFYLTHGYNMLVVDQRSHGKSQGTYIGFGCLDRLDALRWIQYAGNRLGQDCHMLLHGISMGGATVVMASGLDLPPYVKGIVADCAFTSAFEVFSSVLKHMYHIPPFPVMQIADHMAKRKAGYGLDQCNGAKEVKKAKVPMVFIHGDDDTFVPSWMCQKLYGNCAAPKAMLLVKGAGHGEAYYKDPKAYEETLISFFKMGRELEHDEN